jgi:hypothetical protein
MQPVAENAVEPRRTHILEVALAARLPATITSAAASKRTWMLVIGITS